MNKKKQNAVRNVTKQELEKAIQIFDVLEPFSDEEKINKFCLLTGRSKTTAERIYEVVKLGINADEMIKVYKQNLLKDHPQEKDKKTYDAPDNDADNFFKKTARQILEENAPRMKAMTDFEKITRCGQFVTFKDHEGNKCTTFMCNDNTWNIATHFKGYDCYWSGGWQIEESGEPRTATEDEVLEYMSLLRTGLYAEETPIDTAFNGMWDEDCSFIYNGKFYQNGGVMMCDICDCLELIIKNWCENN